MWDLPQFEQSPGPFRARIRQREQASPSVQRRPRCTSSRHHHITFLGLDVSREVLDLHVRPTGQVGRFPNTPDGHRQPLAALPPVEVVALVVLEATGGLDCPVAAVLAAFYRKLRTRARRPKSPSSPARRLLSIANAVLRTQAPWWQPAPAIP